MTCGAVIINLAHQFLNEMFSEAERREPIPLGRWVGLEAPFMIFFFQQHGGLSIL